MYNHIRRTILAFFAFALVPCFCAETASKKFELKMTGKDYLRMGCVAAKSVGFNLLEFVFNFHLDKLSIVHAILTDPNIPKKQKTRAAKNAFRMTGAAYKNLKQNDNGSFFWKYIFETKIPIQQKCTKLLVDYYYLSPKSSFNNRTELTSSLLIPSLRHMAVGVAQGTNSWLMENKFRPLIHAYMNQPSEKEEPVIFSTPLLTKTDVADMAIDGTCTTTNSLIKSAIFARQIKPVELCENIVQSVATRYVRNKAVMVAKGINTKFNIMNPDSKKYPYIAAAGDLGLDIALWMFLPEIRFSSGKNGA